MSSSVGVDTSGQQLSSEVAEVADFSGIRYSQSWEDPRCLEEALELNDDSRVLSIAAAGDNSFALLLMGAGNVVSIDLSPAQCFLVELKAAAIRALDHDDFVGFLGVSDVTPDTRLSLYNRVRDGLTPAAADWWDQNQGILADGVIHAGKLENMWRIFRTRVSPLMHSRRTVASTFEPRTREQRQRFWDTKFNNRRMRVLVRSFFSGPVIARLGRDPAFFEHVEINVGRHYLERTRHVVVNLDPSTNPFFQYVMLGRYTDLSTGHPYLNPENYDLLRSRLDRLEIHCGELERYLADCGPGSFDAFNLSDIFEWMSDELYEKMLGAIVASAKPGARLAYWNNLVERKRPESMANVLAVDPWESARIHDLDRAFLYRGFQVETVM